jgi:LytS/YehU family sensor histidine kinase
MLYETGVERIPLTQELAYINLYLALQKIRSSKENYVDWKVEGDPEGHHIPPMLFFPVIENAFKHLVHKDKSEPAIQIHLQIMPSFLKFTCKNQFAEQSNDSVQKGGLGLALIEKRLALLFPNRFQFSSSPEGSYFMVVITIEIA